MSADNEKLIEEARKTVGIAKDSIWRTSPDPDGDAQHEVVLDQLLAVFEKAHTPTEPRFVTDDGLRTWVATPTDGEREALDDVIRRNWVATPGELRNALLAAGFRRTEVPETSGAIYDAFGTVVTRADTAFELGRQAGRSEPQGEPSDAPTRRVAHTGPGHASGDVGYCEGCLADYEQGASGRIPGEPLTLEDLAREHERLAEHPNQMSQTIPAFHTLTAKALRWAALRAAGGL